MIIKFQQHTDRVKGTSFHPTRPWLLTALYSGVVSLWDYRLQQIVDQFEGHVGPVRAVQFHPKLSLFVSGGDDFTVRVWNYRTRKEQFLLKGHLDYVRCVGFHAEQPWVISSSDDQTARIWNYQSRQMIAIITGHSHYVMQCQFHPDTTKELIVTCSLDQTARLWSYSPLKAKYAGSKKQDYPISGAEITLISVMAGHKDQLNWCTFHPTQPYIATSADDKKIILWKYTDIKCWMFDTLSGHTGNVNSVVFHPKADILISASEDKSIKIWNFTTRKEIYTYTNKELDRFWIVSAHQDNFYFNCGSDSTLFVFTLFKDRVPMALVNKTYIVMGSRKMINAIDLKSGSTKEIKDLSKEGRVSKEMFEDNITEIQYNAYETQNTVLLYKFSVKEKGGLARHAIVTLDPKDSTKQTMVWYHAHQSIFIGKNKAMRIKENKAIDTFNLETTGIQAVDLKADSIFTAPGGKVLMALNAELHLYDDVQKKIILTGPNELVKVKQVQWATNYFAVIGKKTIVLYTKQLTKLCCWTEQIPVKSAIWIEEVENSCFLLYTTKAQLKFALLNGEVGVVKSTENILYLANYFQLGAFEYQITGIDNRENLIKMEVNLKEAAFKQALFEKNFENIQQYMSGKGTFKEKPLGDAMVGYLYQKHFASLAINLIEDKKGNNNAKKSNYQARFSLAVDSHNLEVAFRTCNELNEPQYYHQLGQEALRQGNYQVFELCLKQIGDKQKLGYFYNIMGETQKLKSLQTESIDKNDTDLRVQIGSFLGDIEDRIRVLVQTEQYALAYLCAVTNGMNDQAQEIRDLIEKQSDTRMSYNIQQSIEYLKKNSPEALLPPSSLMKEESQSYILRINWPHNFITQDQVFQLEGVDESKKLEEEISKFNQNTDVLIGLPSKSKEPVQLQQKLVVETEPEQGEGQWGIEEDIDFEDEQKKSTISPPTQEHNQIDYDETFFRFGIEDWNLREMSNSQIASVQLLAGNVDQALQLLRKQIGLKNAQPLKESAISILLTRQQFIGQLPFLDISSMQIGDYKTIQTVVTMDDIRSLTQQGYKTTTEGKFSETLKIFTQLIQKAPLVRVDQSQSEDFFRYLEGALHYVLAMLCEIGKKKCQDNQARVLELGCYMTLCNLDRQHKILTLRSAMSLACKLKNYITGAQLAKKLISLLETPSYVYPLVIVKPEVLQGAQKVLKQCQQQGTNQLKIDFEEDWLYNDKIIKQLSASTLTIMKGKYIQDALLGASYEPERQGELCQISNMCIIGQECIGLKLQ